MAKRQKSISTSPQLFGLERNLANSVKVVLLGVLILVTISGGVFRFFQTNDIPLIGKDLLITTSDIISRRSQAAVPVAQASAEEQAEKYEIQPGDSLWKISIAHYGTGYRWKEIYQRNAQVLGNNPNLIYPGAIIDFVQN